MDKLKDLMDGLIAEKSLSFEVLEQLRKVKTESEELVKINLEQQFTIAQKDSKIEDLTQDNAKLSTSILDWNVREQSLITREKAVLDIEHKNEIEQLKATHANKTLEEIKSVVGIVFKNTSVKRNLNGNTPLVTQTGNGYTTVTSGSKYETEEITEE